MARIFMLKGDINRPGHVDIPEESTTLREVVEQLGGGMANGKRCKAVQIGGPSGGLLSAEQLDLPLHFQQLKPYGIRRGDSVITVLDEDRCRCDTRTTDKGGPLNGQCHAASCDLKRRCHSG